MSRNHRAPRASPNFLVGSIRPGSGIIAAALFVACRASGSTTLVTTTSDYQYNADGAPISITRTTDGGEPTTIYLTWDNYDPATAAVSSGNGRLLGYGAAPGVDSTTSRFTFDRRDRLVGYSGDRTVTYDHYPIGLMRSAALDGGESWRFFYEHSDVPQATNVYDGASGLWSASLRRVRYLSDGTEEVLLQPRKDVACSYQPSRQSVSAYRYDAYGRQDEAPSASYDLRDNPFRYSHELRDPLWGGIYLRARWYHPELPTFLSRDPEPGQVNHYGYGGGNPEMNVDPTGKKYNAYRSFKHTVGRLDSGVGGHFTRLFLGGFLGPLEIAANPKGFWHQLENNSAGIDVFLGAGIAAELVGPIGALAAPEFFQGFSLATRFGVRLATDTGLGLGQSIAAAATHGSGQFSWSTFGKGLETLGGAVLDTRMLGGIGYRRFDLKGADVAKMVFAEENRESVLVFRRQMRLPYHPFVQGGPIQEALHLGLYHEQVVAVTQEGIFTTEVFEKTGVRTRTYFRPYEDSEVMTNEAYIRRTLGGFRGKFEYVGKTTGLNDVTGFDGVNPRNFATEEQMTENPQTKSGYSLFRNNCQHHAYAVRQALGVR